MNWKTVRRFFARAALAVAIVACCESAIAGSIVTREMDSKALGRKWSYNVYLPSGYEASTEKYPVLYLLHGNAQNYTSWAMDGHIQATTDALIAEGAIPATLIVMPDAGTTWYVDRKEQMESAMLHDLIPAVEKEFRVKAERSGRAIAGLSMGGYGAMRFALQHSEMFSAAGLLSPAIYDPAPPENSSARRVGVFGAPNFDVEVWKARSYPALWNGYLAKKMPVPMYIVAGDDDAFHIELSATEFYELLRNNNQPAELRIVDGGHTWQVWESTIGDVMKYIFRYTGKSTDAATGK
jgi:S-formylglutathione hydrolase FrmB